jgi:Linear amide C-N hydrolases, choloylglycine hydrolase family
MNKTFLACLLCSIVTFTLAGCNPAEKNPETPQPTEQSAILPAEAAALNSLERVDDYPLYVMHFSGDFASAEPGESLPSMDFSCSLFAALGDENNLVYGRNFDWDYSPALIVFMDPPNGYASVSMVDLGFLDMEPGDASRLTELSLEERSFLLEAPYMPFDGMNEYGLVVGMAAVEESVAGYDSGKQTMGSIEIIREALDHTKTVEEALALFEAYNIDFRGGPPIHYLLADRGGHAALVEYVQGEMVVLRNENPWHMATNHLRAEAAGDGGCSRYRTIREKMEATEGRLDMASAMDLLQSVSQIGATQWSIVYNFSSGEVQVAMGRAYQTIHTFELEQVTP